MISRRRYRDSLRSMAPETYFLLLTADRADLLDRISARGDHFMPASLLDSQLAALEPLQPGESGTELPSGRGPDHTVEVAAARLLGHLAAGGGE
ncbi:hypothetical protein [Nocardia sp. NBC_00416]|uniref:hypothetical protein n=1 Tax=Nocardia sp. NBC_00416 TaxID=2975991 RepID=UPI002E1BCBC1